MARITDEVDPETGVPVYSLYLAEDRGPSDEMLKDVDVLLYDLQEVGGRTPVSRASSDPTITAPVRLGAVITTAVR